MHPKSFAGTVALSSNGEHHTTPAVLRSARSTNESSGTALGNASISLHENIEEAIKSSSLYRTRTDVVPFHFWRDTEDGGTGAGSPLRARLVYQRVTPTLLRLISG